MKRKILFAILVTGHLAAIGILIVIGIRNMQSVPARNSDPHVTAERLARVLIGTLAPTEAALLGLWAVHGRQRWPWRCAGVVTGDAGLVIVRAAGVDHALLGRLCGAIATITIMVFAIRVAVRLMGRKAKVDKPDELRAVRRFNFSVAQLLLATASVALVAYLARLLFFRDPGFAPAVVVATTLTADWATPAKRRRAGRAAAVLALAFALGWLYAIQIFGFSRIGELFGPVAGLFWRDILQLSAVFQVGFCAQASMALATLWILRSRNDGNTPAGALSTPSTDIVVAAMPCPAGRLR